MFFSVAPGDDVPCDRCGKPCGMAVSTPMLDLVPRICEVCVFAAFFGGTIPDRFVERPRVRAPEGSLSLTDDTRGRLSIVFDTIRGRLSLLAGEDPPKPEVGPATQNSYKEK